MLTTSSTPGTFTSCGTGSVSVVEGKNGPRVWFAIEVQVSFVRVNCFKVILYTIKTAFYNLCSQRPPRLYDQNFVHGLFCTEKFLW